MIYYKNSNNNIACVSWDKSVTQSEYNKAQIYYDDFVRIQKTEKVEIDSSTYRTDEKWEKHVVVKNTSTVEVPLFETSIQLVERVDEEWNIVKVKEEIKQPLFETIKVSKVYNPYEWYTIIPDDAMLITEIEFENEKKKLLKSKESTSEKEVDKKEANDILLSWRFLVNINWKGKKKVATVHDSKTTPEWTLIEYDEERGDINTDNIDIANKYADIVNNESIEKAIEWYKTL